jgi:protein SCO1
MKAFPASLMVAAFGAAFLWHATDGLQALTSESARRLSVARQKPAVPDIVLETMAGKTRPLRPDNGQASVVTFIYTSCPTLCQSAGSELARMRGGLIARGLGDRVRIMSISFDPENDTRDEMTRYGETHDADGKIWTVARPSAKDLPSLLERFGVVVIPNRFGGFEHNAAMHIINPEGKLAAIIDITDISGAITTIEKTLR